MCRATSQRRAFFASGWLLWLWFGLVQPALAAPAVIVDQGFREANLAGHLDLLENAPPDLGFGELVASSWNNAFRPASAADLEQPRPAPVWLRFAVRNAKDQPQLLILRLP